MTILQPASQSDVPTADISGNLAVLLFNPTPVRPGTLCQL